MQYTINQLYHQIFQKVFDIRDIFNNFFGEPYIDLQIENNIILKESIIDFCESHIDGFCDLSITSYSTFFEVSDNNLKNIIEHFSDERACIYIWFPHVTVTNEHNKSVHIQNLYAKIELDAEGKIPYECLGFLLNRATYTADQFNSNYMHSHIQCIPKDDFTRFMDPCLGHGPIRNTINTLKVTYDETMWMLFCQELSMYVTVESLNGGPWHRLEEINSSQRLFYYPDYSEQLELPRSFLRCFSKDILMNFIEYYLKNGHLSLSYKNNKFVSGMPYYEYIIDVSNTFIDYYNKYLKSTKEKLREYYSGTNNLLYEVILVNGNFYYNNENNYYYNFDEYQNKYVLTFKGNDIYTKIIDNGYNDTSITTIINNDTAMYILNSILRIINFRYTNEYNNKQGESEESSSSSKRYFYI